MKLIAALCLLAAVICGIGFVLADFSVGLMFLTAGFVMAAFLAFLLSFAGDDL